MYKNYTLVGKYYFDSYVVDYKINKRNIFVTEKTITNCKFPK